MSNFSALFDFYTKIIFHNRNNITGIIRLKSANSNISLSPVYYMRYCDSPVRFCAVFAQSKNLFWDCENTAQNLTGESQYPIVYPGEKENVRICIIKRKCLHIWNSVSVASTCCECNLSYFLV